MAAASLTAGNDRSVPCTEVKNVDLFTPAHEVRYYLLLAPFSYLLSLLINIPVGIGFLKRKYLQPRRGKYLFKRMSGCNHLAEK